MAKKTVNTGLKEGNPVLKVILAIFLVGVAFISAYPFIYMVAVSLIETYSPKLEWRFVFSDRATIMNYINVMKNSYFLVGFKNTVIVTVCSVLLNLFVASTAAYAFGKKKFTGSKVMYMLYLATMMVPGQVTLIPTFLLLNWMGLLNTHAGMFLPSCGAFGVMLIYSFMKGVPDELMEAADLDGCGELRKFFGIVIPLIKSVLVSLSIFNFISAWGALVLPLIVGTTNDMVTLSVCIANMKGSQINAGEPTNYGLLMAGTSFAFLPPFVMYLFMQKQFVEGIALSGTKG